MASRTRRRSGWCGGSGGRKEFGSYEDRVVWRKAFNRKERKERPRRTQRKSVHHRGHRDRVFLVDRPWSGIGGMANTVRVPRKKPLTAKNAKKSPEGCGRGSGLVLMAWRAIGCLSLDEWLVDC